MTQVSTTTGVWFPDFVGPAVQQSVAGAGTIDAATEKIAHIGHCFIEGRATSKTISAAGGGSISYRTAGVTFANAGTTVDIGIQDVAVAAGPVAQPDGTFDVLRTLTGGGGGITGNAWQTVTMTGGSGTKTISHGDLIAVVWDMTARAGVDTVVVSALSTGLSTNRGLVNTFTGGVWLTTPVLFFPNVLITFDDGTLGYIDGLYPISAQSAETFADATSPDERGLMFQVPWDCKIDAFMGFLGITDNASEFTLKFYSTPTSGATLVTSVAVVADQLGVVANERFIVVTLPSEISLTKNTNYALTMLATGSSNCRLRFFTLGNTAHRAFIAGGTSVAKVTRNNSTGDFAAESPAITIYPLSVRISSFDDGAGYPAPRLIVAG